MTLLEFASGLAAALAPLADRAGIEIAEISCRTGMYGDPAWGRPVYTAALRVDGVRGRAMHSVSAGALTQGVDPAALVVFAAHYLVGQLVRERQWKEQGDAIEERQQPQDRLEEYPPTL